MNKINWPPKKTFSYEILDKEALKDMDCIELMVEETNKDNRAPKGNSR